MKILLIIIVIFFLGVLSLIAWRALDEYHAMRVWRQLAGKSSTLPRTFDPSLLEGLPKAAERFFLFTIQPGAPLRCVTEIQMQGEFGLGTKTEPNYMPMEAQQILAPPYGFVWKASIRQGMVKISGSDGLYIKMSWMRFWLLNIIPIVRAGGGSDHAKSAFGRMVAEAVFWAPATLLPQNGVTWQEIDENTARATLSYNGMEQSLELSVDRNGQPVKIVIPRWSDANQEKTYQIQPFGGYLSNFQEFNGYRLPTYVEGGNFIGTDDYFPFYKASVKSLSFVCGE